jgi:transcriptional regulator with XRE-family HTH domain
VAGGRQGATGFDPQRLRAAREAANLTRGALAEAAGVHVSSIGEWEAGRQVPRVETVAALARALRIEPSALLEPIEGDALTLERLRATAGLSQQQTADAAGLLRNTYSAVERGETAALSYADTQALARVLSVTADQLRAAHTASRAAYLERHPRPNGPARRSGTDS